LDCTAIVHFFVVIEKKKVLDLRLPSLLKWDLRSSRMLRSVEW